ncbi:hypothetical protein NA57DRAFT_52801 [Rhizodiscina lignyota]|uniref:Uncharacterized protein n=1 Tax=Rhizodiscina lignyota TaxID=1504668 RepID=A0A9P4ILC9_9PEZI|nr:hypothetical protein NA57DRAFT_52801 [Rhizodiscina lignyota]
MDNKRFWQCRIVQGIIFFIFQFCVVIRAQDTIQAALWKVPDGTSPDFSQTFTDGESIPLAWNDFSGTSDVNASASLLDLWLTSFDWDNNQYSQLLRKGIDLTTPDGGHFTWTINIPDRSLSVSAKYVLRFKIPASSYNANTGQLSSPGFLVLAAQASSSTSLSSSSETLSSSTTKKVTSTSTNALTATAPTTPSSASEHSLSGGAKAGIGIGVAVAILALTALGTFLFFRRRKISGQVPELPAQQDNDLVITERKEFREMSRPTQEMTPVELPASREAGELHISP